MASEKGHPGPGSPRSASPVTAPFSSEKLSPEMQKAFGDGMADAWAEFSAFKKDKIDTGAVKSGQLFGTKEQLNANYLYRMAGAVIGIYANSNAEAMYPVLSTDSDGAPLTGANSYTLTFPAGSCRRRTRSGR